MKITSKEFEQIMTRLDNDPTVDKKERKLILQQMSICKDRMEFDEFLKSIAISEEEAKKLKKKKRKTTTSITRLCNRVINADKMGGFTIYTKDDVVMLAESYLELKNENKKIKIRYKG